MKKNYSIALDIGVGSVGYAVVDDKYNLVRIKGQKAWGARLFDQAESAADRRIKRSGRRRLDRRKLKLSWLQEVFASEIEPLDKGFLPRMKYSSLFLEDKAQMNGLLSSKDSLFHGKMNGENFTDRDYYKKYLTIYHLRKELTEKPADDVRLLYLAIHNIVKRRGHFLYEGDYNQNSSLTYSFNELIDALNDLLDGSISLKKIGADTEKDLLEALQKSKGIKDTKQKYYQILGAANKFEKKIVDAMLDGKGNTKDFFGTEESVKFAFGDENFAVEQYQNLSALLSDEQLVVIDRLNDIYSLLQLKKILGDNDYICQAGVARYETHRKQLAQLKKFISKYYPSKKYDMFKNPLSEKVDSKKLNFVNYPLYISNSKSGGKKQVVGLASASARTRENFYKYIKSILACPPEAPADEEFEKTKAQILTEIENDNFMLRQRIKSNAVFPHKLYEKELLKILETSSKKYPFLQKKDDSGLTNAEKIVKIFNFRVPYFVGPIGKSKNEENHFGWAQKESDEPLYPWTFEKIVDFDKAEDQFIKKMTNKCTYLKDCDVLPKQSILYSSFRVLNELNKIKINGNSIDVKLKQNIFDNLFKRNKKVSVKLLKEFLVGEGIISQQEVKSTEISGIDKEFANDMSSYFTLSNILGQDFVEKNIQLIEDIILFHTVMSDKARLAKRLQRIYGDVLDENTIAKLKGLNFEGWGRLSKEFLSDLKFANKATGELTSIIDELYQTNQNLQEIIYNSDYTLGDELAKREKKLSQNLTYQDVSELYCSPAVKRGVWQAVNIINEIIELMEQKPDKIFVEVTRHDETKGDAGRKLSRRTNLLAQYQSKNFADKVKEIGVDLDRLFSELNEKDDAALRSEKLHLYFLQLGKCAYSGEPIDLSQLYNEHAYDVDHIIPQSIIKDDSIDNKVLVKSEYNKNKSDCYPISSKFDWATKQQGFWQILRQCNLMSEGKYSRLVRKQPLSDAELGGFIARSLVETNQTAKAVIELLKNIVDDPRDIVYSKAKYVSEFRNKFDIYKCREVNDLHHAKDAYLNAVVGNILFNRFTDDPRNFYKNDTKNKNLTKNIKKLFENEVKDFKTGDIIWNGQKDIARIKDIVSHNDCKISYLSYSNQNGGFYDDTVYKSAKNDPKTKAKISLKGEGNPLSDFDKYGGYNNMAAAYFMVFESYGKGKKGQPAPRRKTIETLPIYILRKYRNDPDKDKKYFDYIVSTNNLKNPVLLVDKLNIKSTLVIGKGRYLLAGKTGNRYILHNANEWFVEPQDEDYIKAIVKFIDLKNQKKTDHLVEENGKVILSPKTKDGNKEISLSAEQNIAIFDMMTKQLDKDIYSGLALEGFNETLKSKRENFEKLDVFGQAEVLYQIVKRLSTGAALADLTLIGGAGNSGIILMNKDITDKNVKVEILSITGLLKKTIIL